MATRKGGTASQGPYDLKALCRLETPENLKTLKRIRDNEKAPAVARLRAVEVMLERAYGKAVQMMEVDWKDDRAASELSRDELTERAAAIIAGIGPGDSSGIPRPN